jgi:hypothetical protein
MKNIFKVLGITALIMVIGFSMAACDDGGGGGSGGISVTVGSTNGQLTITGLNSYSGKWVMAQAYDDNEDFLYAAAKVTSSAVISGGKIGNDGKATLKLWKITSSSQKSATFGDYSGSGELEFNVVIMNKESVSASEVGGEGGADDGSEGAGASGPPSWMLGMGEATGTAASGKIEAVFLAASYGD